LEAAPVAGPDAEVPMPGSDGPSFATSQVRSLAHSSCQRGSVSRGS